MNRWRPPSSVLWLWMIVFGVVCLAPGVAQGGVMDEIYRKLSGGGPYKVVGTDVFQKLFGNDLPAWLEGKGPCAEESRLGNLYDIKAQETKVVEEHNAKVQTTMDEIRAMADDLSQKQAPLRNAIDAIEKSNIDSLFYTHLSPLLGEFKQAKHHVDAGIGSDGLREYYQAKLEGLEGEIDREITKLRNYRLSSGLFSRKQMTLGEADAVLDEYLEISGEDAFSLDVLLAGGWQVFADKLDQAKITEKQFIDAREELVGVASTSRVNSSKSTTMYDKLSGMWGIFSSMPPGTGVPQPTKVSQLSLAAAEIKQLPSHGVTKNQATRFNSTSKAQRGGYVWEEGKSSPTQVANCISEAEAEKRGWSIVTQDNIGAVNAQLVATGQQQVQTKSATQQYFSELRSIFDARRRGEITREESYQMRDEARRRKNQQLGWSAIDEMRDAYATDSARFSMWQRLRTGTNSPIAGKPFDDPDVQRAIDDAMLAAQSFGGVQSGRDVWEFNAYVAAQRDATHPCYGALFTDTECQTNLEEDYRNPNYVPSWGWLNKSSSSSSGLDLRAATMFSSCPVGTVLIVEEDGTGRCGSSEFTTAEANQIRQMFPEDCDAKGNCYSPEFYSGVLYCEDSTGQCLPPGLASCPAGVTDNYVTPTRAGLCRKIIKDPWWKGTVFDRDFIDTALSTFASDSGIPETTVRSVIDNSFGSPSTQSPFKIYGDKEYYTIQQNHDIASVLKYVTYLGNNTKRVRTRLSENLQKDAESGGVPNQWRSSLSATAQLLLELNKIGRDPMTPVVM